jgi:hypothetical protein
VPTQRFSFWREGGREKKGKKGREVRMTVLPPPTVSFSLIPPNSRLHAPSEQSNIQFFQMNVPCPGSNTKNAMMKPTTKADHDDVCFVRLQDALQKDSRETSHNTKMVTTFYHHLLQ